MPDTEKGFRARYLNLKLSGDIAPGFSYNYRQRFSKDMLSASSFLNSTDYIYLDYRPTQRWTLTAGKQFVAVGGFEYDYAPIDVYLYSQYCDFVECYGYGLSATYAVTPNDNIQVQAAQSAFAPTKGIDRYSYNVLWRGTHGAFSSISSMGLHEWDRHKFLHVTALSGKYDFGCGHVFVDWTNRYDTSSTADAGFFDDFTLAGECHVRPVPQVNIFGRYCFDRNVAKVSGDPTVHPGTEIHTFGGGVEFLPLKGDPDVRVHAAYFRKEGTNGNPSGTHQPGTDYLTIGLTWRFNYDKVAARMKNLKS